MGIAMDMEMSQVVLDGLQDHDDLQAVAVCIRKLTDPFMRDPLPLNDQMSVAIKVKMKTPNVPPVPARYGFIIEGEQAAIARFRSALDSVNPHAPICRIFRATQPQYVVLSK